MSNQAIMIQESQENTSTLSADKSKQVAFDARGTAQNGVSPLQLAFMMLVKAANINTQTAAARAKDLQQNAIEQKRLNEEDEKLQLGNVKEVEKHVVYYTVSYGVNGTVFDNRHTRTEVNKNAMRKEEEKNREVMAKRQIVGEKLQVLEQGASIEMQRANMSVSESMQAMKEGSKILTDLKSLTFLALLRKPVQG